MRKRLETAIGNCLLAGLAGDQILCIARSKGNGT
jgi:hypothetical protein